MNDFGGYRDFALYNNVDFGEFTYVDEDSLKEFIARIKSAADFITLEPAVISEASCSSVRF